MKKKHKCKRCPWSTDVGGKYFCMLPKCIKQLKDDKRLLEESPPWWRSKTEEGFYHGREKYKD